ncbi:MAG TPA: hypothetical protein VGL77_14985, partial [Armatimonadota bacterium]
MMVRCLVLCLFIIGALLPLAASQWVGVQSNATIVFAHDNERQIAQQIGAMANEECARLVGPLGLWRITPFPIYAYTSRVEFMRDSGLNPSLMGVSYRPSGLIRLDVTGTEGPVRAVLAHELTHTLLAQRLGGNMGSLPDWLNEGIAGFLAQPVAREDLPGLAHQQHRNGLLTMPAMEKAFATGVGTDAAYVQSRSMVAWLEYTHPGALTQLLDNLVQGKSFPRALEDATGLTPEDWL